MYPVRVSTVPSLFVAQGHCYSSLFVIVSFFFSWRIMVHRTRLVVSHFIFFFWDDLTNVLYIWPVPVPERLSLNHFYRKPLSLVLQRIHYTSKYRCPAPILSAPTNMFSLDIAVNNCLYFCYSWRLAWKEVLTPKLSFSKKNFRQPCIVVHSLFSVGQTGQQFYPSLPIFVSCIIFPFPARWNLVPQQELYIFIDVQWIVTGTPKLGRCQRARVRRFWLYNYLITFSLQLGDFQVICIYCGVGPYIWLGTRVLP